jgi:hypothetical protein
MSQRISLDENDFKKLVRGEVVEQGALSCALQDIGHEQIYNAVADAIARVPVLLDAYSLREDDEDVRRWIHGINQGEPTPPGSFLEAFAATVCRADSTNYPFLRPAILALKAKFPKYRFSGEL